MRRSRRNGHQRRILAVLQVDIYHQALFFLIAGTVVELALRTGYETAAPELDALGLTA